VDRQTGERPEHAEQAKDRGESGLGDGGHGRFSPFTVTTLLSLTLLESHSRVIGAIPDVRGNLFPVQLGTLFVGHSCATNLSGPACAKMSATGN
jgi:hypothetical protein